jgi:hypothetical protein
MKFINQTKMLCAACVCMLMAILVISCESDSAERAECYDGFRKCMDVGSVGRYQICENHKWSDPKPCPGMLSCQDDESCQPYNPDIDPQPTEYETCNEDDQTSCHKGILRICYYGIWAYTPCESGMCQNDIVCAEKCEEGAVKCMELGDSLYGILAKCRNGVWVEEDSCGHSSCKSDTECGECTNTSAALYRTWVDYCHRGTMFHVECNDDDVVGGSKLCTGECDGSQPDFCWEYLKKDGVYLGESYKCIKGEWVKKACGGSCNADNTDCAQ